MKKAHVFNLNCPQHIILGQPLAPALVEVDCSSDYAPSCFHAATGCVAIPIIQGTCDDLPKIVSILCANKIQTSIHLIKESFQVCCYQTLPDFGIITLAQWIQVQSESTWIILQNKITQSILLLISYTTTDFRFINMAENIVLFTREYAWILRYDSNRSPQTVESDGVYPDSIDINRSFSCLQYPQ